MSFYEFGKNDLFYNRIKTHPKVNFVIYDTKIYYNNNSTVSGAFTENVGHIPVGSLSLYEINVDRPFGGLVYPFITKNGNLTGFKTVDTSTFNNEFIYGDILTGSYPLSSRISIDKYALGQDRPAINSLQNTLNFYKTVSPHYAYESYLGDKSSQRLKLISIPSIFFGSSIKKGSVDLKFYVSGTLAAQLVDSKRNGELRQVLPDDANSGSVAGIVLYNEGFLVLTGSWDIHPTHTENYYPDVGVPPRWIDFATTGSSTPADGTNVASSSFSIDFEGIQYVPILTMFAHAPKSELNFSNNPTFIKFGQTTAQTSSLAGSYHEKDNVEIKNVVKSNFIEPTGSFQKETYISKIGIYDEDQNLIGVAKLATPVRKREIDSFTFKLKIDF